ncbi:DNA-binding response OmpR family regulator [Rhodanobacter sp. K2T2]|jgi:DNA-binding response OmpR family regulator|uniref:response regulator transcription factor n=1 Tax=Rhodanobacter sp. K2T2 TaxID=2723085 RepID=UPI0015C91860|nr:response regulator transcription factor [Rhodanobacter sp. K2T2]NYE27507.1 DNA-binding response OmpR family regulator [Rhodanobacter sp. K2T2]
MRTRTGKNGLILIVEDHQLVARVIGETFEQRNYSVDYASDGTTGLHLAVCGLYEAIILDLTLPGINGLELCQKLRQVHKKSTPILMLSGRDTLDDKIAGLEAGADDYLVKPFDLAELEGRVRALIRRYRGQVVTGVFTVADMTLDSSTGVVTRAGKFLTLSPMGLRLLKILMRKSPNYVTREEIEREIWGDTPPDTDTLRSHIYTLRSAVDKPFSQPLLQTIPYKGCFGLVPPEYVPALRSSLGRMSTNKPKASLMLRAGQK